MASDQATGGGLGLAISRALIEAQHGRRWVDLQVEAGAALHFWLPGVADAASAQ